MNKISLVMATLDRVIEIENFIESLMNQNFSNYELIIVDQNKHNLVEQIYLKYRKYITIKYIRSSKLGLSVNRNIGLEITEGNIVAFPDDDCEYDFNTLEKVDNYFNINNNRQIYCCKVIDKNTGEKFGKSSEYNEEISYKNIMKNCVSISVFVKFKNKRHIKFNEKLGAGCYFASGEESDLIFTLIHHGYKGDYHCNDVVFHPARCESNIDLKKNNKDSLGLGALMKSEIYYRKNLKMIPFFVSRLIRPILGCILNPQKSNFYINSVKFRIKGYLEYNEK